MQKIILVVVEMDLTGVNRKKSKFVPTIQN